MLTDVQFLGDLLFIHPVTFWRRDVWSAVILHYSPVHLVVDSP